MKGFLLCLTQLVLFLGFCIAIPCPTDVETMNNFDPSAFSPWPWIQISRINTSLFDKKKCIITTFQTQNNSLSSFVELYKNEKDENKQDGALINMPHGKNSGYLNAIYSTGTVVYMHIVTTNYFNYALVLGCTKSFLRNERHAWILSRNPLATPWDLEPAYQKLEQKGFKRSDLVTTYNPLTCGSPI